MFPDKPYEQADSYAADYFREIGKAGAAVDAAAFDRAATLLADCLAGDHIVFACGNGGSAAISNHLLCDFAKGIQGGTSLRPKVVSLSSNVEIITAIGNDLSYDDIFLFQLRTAARPGDVLFTISSSGNSENIVRAIAWAKQNGVGTVALTGFDGGRSAQLAAVNIHIPSYNYGVVEDLHQACMHILAQYTRQKNMPRELVGKSKF